MLPNRQFFCIGFQERVLLKNLIRKLIVLILGQSLFPVPKFVLRFVMIFLPKLVPSGYILAIFDLIFAKGCPLYYNIFCVKVCPLCQSLSPQPKFVPHPFQLCQSSSPCSSLSKSFCRSLSSQSYSPIYLFYID
jgi:hypothetical protein